MPETFEGILPELDFTGIFMGIFTGIRNFLKYTTEKFGIPAANTKLCLVKKYLTKPNIDVSPADRLLLLSTVISVILVAMINVI